MSRPRVGAWVVVLGLVVLFGSLSLFEAVQAQASTVGNQAPNFSGTTMDGQAVAIGDYAGKPLVLVFWASW